MGWRVTVCVMCAVTLVAGVSVSDYLLPGDVVPRHYDVRFVYDVDPNTNFSFYAVVDIKLTAKRPTSQIVLHAQTFNISNEAVTLKSRNNLIGVSSVNLNDTYNFLTIKLDKTLEENKDYTLTIPFYGNLKSGLDGVYISTYTAKESKAKQYLIATQFEAISARKGFPCFDEPMYKATFTITIGHQKSYTAVSNMPLYNTSNVNSLEDFWTWQNIEKTFKKPQSEFVWDQFEKSVPMSTYLVAFVVSQFSYSQSPSELSPGTRFRIWARKDAMDQTSYAATLGPKVLTIFEQWFNVSFPLPKQDMFAIPDFSAGAMENWGLITYREASLLYDKDESSFLNKERVAEVIAHELAHQWFGNLVTMKWWQDLWLNEGFATYAASVGVAGVEPTWQADDHYAMENMQIVLAFDALETSHPVSAPIDDPRRINEIFDEISYRKGSTLIRMMTMFLGQDVFRKAIHQYLVKYSYSNAQQDDLWRELTDVSQQYGALTRNVSVKTIMDTWTTQTGYPLLTVTRDYSDNSVTVSQKRYLHLGSKASTQVSWWVPLSVMCESEAGNPRDPVEWLSSDEGVKNKHRFEHSATAKEWILFNPDMIAPYRVDYDLRNWQLLIDALASDQYTKIPTLGRVQLLSDAFALAWSNHLDYSVALQLANYLQRENEYLPLWTGLRALGKLDGMLRRTAEYGAFQRFVRRLISRQYHEAGGLANKRIDNGDDLISVKMQTMTSSWACSMKIPGCEENAIQLFQNWMDTENPDEDNPIPLDLRKTVYCVAIRRGSVVEWRFALARLRHANVAAARNLLQHALACTREVWVLMQYLEWTITEGSEVRQQDAGQVISLIAGAPVGFYVAKDFIYTRINDIADAFQGHGRRLGHIVKALLSQFTTERELEEFLTWKKSHEKYFEDAKLSVAQAIEAAKVNIDWLKRNKKVVIDKLREGSM